MLQRAVTVQQGSLHRLGSRAAAALRGGDVATVKACCVRMLEQDPDCADAYYWLGVMAGESRRNRVAVDTLRKAIALDPERPEFHSQAARFLLAAGRVREAVGHALRACELGMDDAFQLDTVGCVLSQAGLQEQARPAFEKAAMLAPENGQYRYNLASCLRFLGAMHAAEDQFESCIRLDPDHYKAHWALSHLRTQSRERNHMSRLDAVAGKREWSDDARSFLHYALGKEHEDLEEYDRAFRHYAAGAAARRRMVAYDARDSETLVETIMRTFDAKYLASRPGGWTSEEPIFVFGMPRSGTTLVERILSSHTDVSSAGELLNFGIEVKRLTRAETHAFIDELTVRRAAALDPADLGRAYIESTRPVTGGARRFVDKLPFNFLYLGLIARALPGAKLVHVRRAPMDTCFSMFKQRFAAAYDYSYTLEELAAYYGLYWRLMEHWRTVLGARIHEVGYEALVCRQRATTATLLDFCGLEWQDRCLEFHRNDSAVATASASQVREPIHRSSLGKWRKFERHLGPLREALEQGGVPPEHTGPASSG